MHLESEHHRTLCDHDSAAGPLVTHLRGTILVSSLVLLKQAGHFPRYLTLLPAELREVVPLTLALSWVPMEVALAHYRACESLGLEDDEVSKLGELAGARYASTFLGTLLRTVQSAGVEAPWLALRSQGRVWDRVYMGGGILAARTGPKDARLEMRGLPLAQFRYFRQAYRGWFLGVGSLLVKKLYLKLTRARSAEPHAFALTGSWV